MKLFDVVAPAPRVEAIQQVAHAQECHDFRLGQVGDDGRQSMRLLVRDDQEQATLDALQELMEGDHQIQLYVLDVGVVLPEPPEQERKKEDAATAAREELYATAEKYAQLNFDTVVLILLSTLVASIALIKGQTAVLIGAMLIAPVLGPNLSLALGTALGDLPLMRKSLIANAGGLSIAIGLGFLIGAVLTFDAEQTFLLAQTEAGLENVALSLASGVAAALSLTSGVSGVLVGVAVSVALLPPAATVGLMLGQGRFSLAAGSAILLAVNVVCVNLACKLVFLAKGIRPRTWWEKERARRSTRVYLAVWVITLVLLILAILAPKFWTSLPTYF